MLRIACPAARKSSRGFLSTVAGSDEPVGATKPTWKPASRCAKKPVRVTWSGFVFCSLRVGRPSGGRGFLFRSRASSLSAGRPAPFALSERPSAAPGADEACLVRERPMAARGADGGCGARPLICCVEAEGGADLLRASWAIACSAPHD